MVHRSKVARVDIFIAFMLGVSTFFSLAAEVLVKGFSDHPDDVEAFLPVTGL